MTESGTSLIMYGVTGMVGMDAELDGIGRTQELMRYNSGYITSCKWDGLQNPAQYDSF